MQLCRFKKLKRMGRSWIVWSIDVNPFRVFDFPCFLFYEIENSTVHLVKWKNPFVLITLSQVKIILIYHCIVCSNVHEMHNLEEIK